MTVSILETLAILPSGQMGQELSSDQLSQYLRDNYNGQVEKDREARHRLRDELFMDGGVSAMESLIDKMFVDYTVRDMRKRWVKHARFNNPIKRIVIEDSTIYSEPATRTVKNKADNDRYQDLQLRCRQAEQFIRINRLLNLHRALLVGFRVRELPGGEREPVIDVATPSNLRAVVHPNDASLVVGWLMRVAHRNFHTSESDRMPMWVLETDHERASLTDDFRIIGKPVAHGFKRSRWVPITRGPVVPGFWPGEEGEDLVAGHLAIWFANICMLKETKSATNQTILSGDLSSMARAQASDTETPIEAPDGVSVSSVDMSMDVSMFGATADHILERLGNNYGLSGPLLKHQGTQSADARELMRVPLKERRREQQVPLRAFERQFVEVQQMVLERDMPELAFSTEGWALDFGESQTPLSEDEKLVLFEKGRGLGVTNTVAFIREQNPDLDDEQALTLLEHNIEMELLRNELMRPLMAINGGLGQSLDEARTPQQNGSDAEDEDDEPIQEMAS